MFSESKVRYRARRRGYRACKSRERMAYSNNKGLWQLVNDRNTVVLGVNFDATLEQIDAYFREEDARNDALIRALREEMRPALLDYWRQHSINPPTEA